LLRQDLHRQQRYSSVWIEEAGRTVWPRDQLVGKRLSTTGDSRHVWIRPSDSSQWQQRVGEHSRQVHEHVIEQSQLDLSQVQADEIKVKTQRGSVWLALAITVATRLWIGGAVSPQRDKTLIRRLANQVRQIAQYQPLLVAVDGLSSYVKAFRLAFRSKQYTGKPGAPRKVPWPHLAIILVVKRRQAGEFSIERRIVQGCAEMIQLLITILGVVTASTPPSSNGSMPPSANDLLS